MPEIPQSEGNNNSVNIESDEDKKQRLITAGVNGEMDEINNLTDRVLRGKIKAAIVKEKRRSSK